MAENTMIGSEEDGRKDREGGEKQGASEVQAEAVMTMGNPQPGRGGQLILCSVIPCVVLYCIWKFYRKRLKGGPQPFISSRAFGAYGSEENTQDDLHNGVTEMGLAENQLSIDLVQEWLASHPKVTIDPASLREDAGNNDYDGMLVLESARMPALKSAVASYMAQVMRREVWLNESQIVLTAGASSAMEILSFCLSEQGRNAFLVPSPYNPSFNWDIKWRTGVELVPVPCRSINNFNITIPALEIAYNRSRSRRLTIRAILISNPSNPVGKFLNSNTLQRLLKFAMDKNLHLICDETQAGSIYGIRQFTSIAQVLNSGEFDPNKVHIIYDLGIPEFRVGVLYSHNADVMKAAQKLARFSPLSSLTQRCLIAMLSDSHFLEKYIAENQKRLRARFCQFADGLDRLGIKYFGESNGGVYCWVDMRSLMESYSEKGELALLKRLLSEAEVNVTPGSGCRCIEPGWFRFCFATIRDPAMIEKALERIQKRFLDTLSNK